MNQYTISPLKRRCPAQPPNNSLLAAPCGATGHEVRARASNVFAPHMAPCITQRASTKLALVLTFEGA